MDWITVDADARAEATVDETKIKQVAAWRCQNNLLLKVGIEQYLFLDGLSYFHKKIVFSVFTQAVRDGTFS